MIAKTILVPIDFSPPSEHALEYACALAAKTGATVHLVNALDAGLPELTVALSGERLRELVMEHRDRLDRIAEVRRALVPIGSVEVSSGDPREAILEAAKRNGVDLIVMGTHGRRGLSRFMLGSVTEAIMRRADCPVLAVREGAA